MKLKKWIVLLLGMYFLGCSSINKLERNHKFPTKWHAVHLIGYKNDQELTELEKIIPELKKIGVNVIVLEVDYNFTFKSFPKLRNGNNTITKQGARKFAKICRKNGVNLIPEFQCLGHQSWKEKTFPLLSVYPALDITPGAFPNNKGLYCREWDPLNPKVNRIVFQLIDEIIDAFKADAFHVGMDEVFLLGDKHSPSTRGKDPGKLFARVVNDYHDHLAEHGVQMLMWGDRLFDGRNYDFGKWESSLNGTASAVDMIPKDIIICPWHYEKRKRYPSIPFFIKKGFRVLPASWKDVDASKALIKYSYAQKSPNMLGHLFTTWHRLDLLKYSALVEDLKLLNEIEENSQ